MRVLWWMKRVSGGEGGMHDANHLELSENAANTSCFIQTSEEVMGRSACQSADTALLSIAALKPQIHTKQHTCQTDMQYKQHTRASKLIYSAQRKPLTFLLMT